MRLIVIVPTVGRRDVLAATVARLAHQTRRPDAVIVSTTSVEHIPSEWLASVGTCSTHGFPIVCLFGDKGCCNQRNAALDVVLGRRPLNNLPSVLAEPLTGDETVTFFDDDFIPADDYLERVEQLFRNHPDWAGLTGVVPYDGARNEGYDFEQGVALLERIERVSRPAVDMVGAYGCNMSFRAGSIGAVRFDERLPLYAWQEDIDFSYRVRNRGRVVKDSSLVGVHLGTKAGRVKGVRFGYSQIANPLYLIRKGTMPRRFGLKLMLRNIAANSARSLWPERYVDRRGRLYGNLVGLAHVITGRVKPEYILEL